MTTKVTNKILLGLSYIVVLSWMHNKREIVWHVTMESHIVVNICNNDNDYNDDEDMCASVWLNFWWLILISALVIHGRESQLQGVKLN